MRLKMKMTDSFTGRFLTLSGFIFLVSCFPEQSPSEPGADMAGHTPPSRHTVKHQAGVRESINLSEQQDFIEANRGLIAKEEEVLVKNDQGKTIWDTSQYNFIKGEAPASVNPSLWRQAKLNNIHGLFKVSEGIYQIRGYDLSNITIIEGKTGWVIVDTLTASETAKAAMDFARKHLNNEDHHKPIKAIIYTHSHIDHFGGINGILSAEEAKQKNVRIIAPLGFTEAVTSENILVGLAMGRRAMMMYGRHLSRSERGHVGSGLGKSPAYGSFGFIQPTEIIDHTGQTLEIDGLQFIFQYAPESEAPAELTFYLPERKAFCGAELVSRTMHNLYTLRGAKVRDALKWSSYINEARRLFAESEVYFASHHWPMWGQENISSFLAKQADGYQFTHDQSVRLINEGFRADEIAESIRFPEALQQSFSNRGYYGTLKHNSKAVYQNYMGWYDANPANLNPLPVSSSAEKYIELMGGPDVVIEASNIAYKEGQYRWAAELLNKLVFAKPKNKQARHLLANTYDQLGYQSESGPWRDVYLSAALELRHGKPKEKLDPSLMTDVLKETPSEYFMDSISVNMNGRAAEGLKLIFNFSFSDTGENFIITIDNSVFHYKKSPPSKEANASIKISRSLFIELITKQGEAGAGLFGDDFELEGSKLDLLKFLRLIKSPNADFNIVTP
jgi:alkyl sulfatase BDS1-like metallo-beta-lactamase superfamily hydrolase